MRGQKHKVVSPPLEVDEYSYRRLILEMMEPFPTERAREEARKLLADYLEAGKRSWERGEMQRVRCNVQKAFDKAFYHTFGNIDAPDTETYFKVMSRLQEESN